MTTRMQLHLAAAGMAAGLLLFDTEARATSAAKHDADSAAKAADDRPEVAAGQKAAVDAAGKLRPVTPEEARTLVEGMARHVDQSTDGLLERYHANGAVSMDLDDRFQSVSLARVTTDGRVRAACVSTVPEAERFLGAGAKAPARSSAAKATAPRQAAKAAAPAKAKPAAAATASHAQLEER